MTRPRSIGHRKGTPVHPSLDHRLMAYAAAATAAGIGMLGTPKTAEAKIVYTPTNITVGVGGSIAIDVNNDGTPDFEVVGFSCEHSNCLAANPLAVGNGIQGRGGFAAAGVYGLPVGPEGQFITKSYSTNGGHRVAGFMADESLYGDGGSGGPWANTTNRYLGLQFLINGKIHYGWARMSVKMLRNEIHLTGYAYETIPNHKLLAGHTSGLSANMLAPADRLAPGSEPASLGLLARGSHSLAAWRRKDEVIERR